MERTHSIRVMKFRSFRSLFCDQGSSPVLVAKLVRQMEKAWRAESGEQKSTMYSSFPTFPICNTTLSSALAASDREPDELEEEISWKLWIDAIVARPLKSSDQQPRSWFHSGVLLFNDISLGPGRASSSARDLAPSSDVPSPTTIRFGCTTPTPCPSCSFCSSSSRVLCTRLVCRPILRKKLHAMKDLNPVVVAAIARAAKGGAPSAARRRDVCKLLPGDDDEAG